MNLLKSRYPELQTLFCLYQPTTSEQKPLFRTIFFTQKLTPIQIRQWKELLTRDRSNLPMDTSTFLFNLLVQCQNKNRSNLLLTNLNLKSLKLNRTTFQMDVYLNGNPLINHLCQSSKWFERRRILSDDAVIYLLSEFNVIECLSRKRQLFIQLSGIQETFYTLPYYQIRTERMQKQSDQRILKRNRRQRTIQFRLHATREGQQAHLTELYQKFMPRHWMCYHVSKSERFDVYHPIETSFNGEMLVEAMIQSEFSRQFFQDRPKQEVDEICERLQPIFDQFRQNHHRFFLRRRSRLPFNYTQHHVPEPTATLDQLIPLTTSASTIQKFLRFWLKKVLPIELFGTKQNHHRFIRKMLFFIQLPRTQQYSLGDAIRSLKTNEFFWSKFEQNQRLALISQIYICHLIYFLIQYVLTLIRSYFYVTEASSPSHPLILVYYRHKIWHVIQQKSHKDLIGKSCSATVEKSYVSTYESIRYFWKIRFVPKTSSIRYIARAQSQLNTKENLEHMKYTNEILKYLRRHNAHLMGISAVNRSEMHRRWQNYCRSAPKLDDGSMIYFLRSDVSNFYDSINLDYLDQALINFLDKCQFNYDLYVHTIYKSQYRYGRIVRKRTIFWVGRENEQLCNTLADDTKHLNNGIFHDMIVHDGHVEHYNREKLLKYIRAQLYNSHLYTRHHTKSALKTYRRTVGINHGLPTASILGQIYLNQIDQDIDFVPLFDEFAVRHEDDLLIISPHRYRLRRIKSKITAKLNELHRINNPLTNSLKTKTNIRHRTMKKFRPVEYWGSLVDIHSRQIYAHVNQADSIERKIHQLTIQITRETGFHLRYSLLNALCLRSHRYYFDRLYTSDSILVRNVFVLSKYFLQRLHAMCVRFAQFFSKKFLQSKSLFLFRTIRSALHLLMKKVFYNENVSRKLKEQCKYVFYYAAKQLFKQNLHLFRSENLLQRFSHLMKKLKYLNKKHRSVLKKLVSTV